MRLSKIFYINNNNFHHLGRPQMCAGAWYVFRISKPHSERLCRDFDFPLFSRLDFEELTMKGPDVTVANFPCVPDYFQATGAATGR